MRSLRVIGHSMTQNQHKDENTDDSSSSSPVLISTWTSTRMMPSRTTTSTFKTTASGKFNRRSILPKKRMLLKSSSSSKVMIPNITSTKYRDLSPRSPPPPPAAAATAATLSNSWSPGSPLKIFRRKGNRTNTTSSQNSKSRFKSPWPKVRTSTSANTNIHTNNTSQSPRHHTPRSEKTILGNDKFDGIEVSLKHHGMEVLHVIGQEEFEKERNKVSSPLNLMDGILGHTTPVFHQDFSRSHFHAVCDFDFMRLKHRVPIRSGKMRRKEEELQKDVKVDMGLLERHPVLVEEEALIVEMRHLWNEMKAIDLDRRKIVAKKQRKDSPAASDCHARWNVCSTQNCGRHWDINIYLDGVDKRKPGKIKSDATDVGRVLKKYLQQRRGAYFHAGFPVIRDKHGNDKNAKVFQSFAMKCGGNPSSCEPHKSLTEYTSFMKLFGLQCVSTTSTNVRHLAIMTDEDKSPTFFTSKDDGRFHCGGTLPSRLLKRLEEEQEQESNNTLMRNIRYLSLGPNDSYYAELVSGQCYWGIGRYDEDFQNAVDEMDVHRVAFGSFELDSSWIVISKEGQISWRNIPPRLHRLLQRRQENQAAPCEISLGTEGTYFIRFLDGEIDYCLSCFADEMARGILSREGADITNIILNPNVPNAFIIRHTELPK